MNNTNLPQYLSPGVKNQIGNFEFNQEDIIAFAQKYDPQVFHTDPIAAKDSLFGSLCASGWHTISIWMKLQRNFAAAEIQKLTQQDLPLPEFGPSPGMQDIKWPSPVFTNDTISYFTEIAGLRTSNSRPDWSIMTQNCGGYNQNEEQVLSFTSTVFIKIP